MRGAQVTARGIKLTGTCGLAWGIAPRAHLVLELAAPVRPPLATDLATPARALVLSAHQLPDSGPGVDPAVSRFRGDGAVRRWERRTIVEPAVGPQAEGLEPEPPVS